MLVSKLNEATMNGLYASRREALENALRQHCIIVRLRCNDNTAARVCPLHLRAKKTRILSEWNHVHILPKNVNFSEHAQLNYRIWKW